MTAESGFTTAIVHHDRHRDNIHGAVHQPVYPSVEYAFSESRELAAVFQGKAGYTYSRQGTPTTTALEHQLTQMEEGVDTVSFATGMAALAAVFFTLLKAGDHIVSSHHIFGNTNSLLGTLADFGVCVTFVDARQADAVEAALQSNTRMVFAESLANPGTQIADLFGIGALCRDKGILFVLDGTLTTPWLLQGRKVGAGLVVNSLSKHFGGHGNALGGAVTDTGVFNWEHYPHIAKAYRQGSPRAWGLRQVKKKGLRDMGATLSSDVAHRLSAGAETLALRMAQACHNALSLAQVLETHPQVLAVHYPGLASHPQHQRAKTLFKTHFGALLAVELQSNINVFDFLDRLKVFALATHLGDTRTLVLPVAHTIYHEMGAARRKEMGIADNLLRISAGIEDTQDLIDDFTQALELTG